MINAAKTRACCCCATRMKSLQILPSCFGYRVADEHLAGICSLLTEPYHREHAGELTALYTLTRFQGEGVGVELVHEVLKEAQARKLRYVFACTSEERAARFFKRLKFRKVGHRKTCRRRSGAITIASGSSGCRIFRIELPAQLARAL